jgi:Flp pilus assembly protein TadG
MTYRKSEKGQALILITLAAVGLFAFAALAIDGSMVFSDRRHAQNAADTSALAAALAKIRGKDWATTVSTARERADTNGYNNDSVTNTVEVFLCNDSNASCNALPAGADKTQYLQVKITSHVKTYFARIIGRSEMVNHVAAVARVTPSTRTSVFGGKALVALNKTACPAMDYKGSSTTTVTGSGIFVNSSCNSGSNQAFNANTGSGTFSAPCMNVVGGITLGTNTILNSPGTSCANRTNDLGMQITDPDSTYKKPNPCGTTTGTYNSTTLNPGNYSGAFPPGNQTAMNPGVYCIDAGNQGFSLSGGQTLTGNNVMIYMKTGNVSWTSGGIHLSAMQGVNADYDGLLLYLASGNCNDVSITGNGTSSYVGTILAPCSNVKLAGGSSTGSVLENQIIADTITLTGSNTLNINFNATQQWQPPSPAGIQINQ